MITQFPNFTQIAESDRDEYNQIAQKFPPISDLSFTTFMIWWNFDPVKVAKLDDNVVISYYLPGDDKNSGLSLVGVDNVDSNIRSLFAEQKSRGEERRLVHVPEFVVKAIANPSDFEITPERDYDEYIIDPTTLYPLENADHNTRRKIKKFWAIHEDALVEVKALDLSIEEDQDLLIQKAHEWERMRMGTNDESGIELAVLPISIKQSAALAMYNICVFMDGELCGFAVFQLSYDKQYLILNHVKVKPGVSRLFDYVTYLSAQWATEHDIPYINLEMDLGIPGLRQHKLELKPINFFHKFEIRPAAL